MGLEIRIFRRDQTPQQSLWKLKLELQKVLENFSHLAQAGSARSGQMPAHKHQRHQVNKTHPEAKGMWSYRARYSQVGIRNLGLQGQELSASPRAQSTEFYRLCVMQKFTGIQTREWLLGEWGDAKCIDVNRLKSAH